MGRPTQLVLLLDGETAAALVNCGELLQIDHAFGDQSEEAIPQRDAAPEPAYWQHRLHGLLEQSAPVGWCECAERAGTGVVRTGTFWKPDDEGGGCKRCEQLNGPTARYARSCL